MLVTFGYRLSLLAAAALLTACASAPPNLDDDQVVRGKRIGTVELGMPLATLLAIWGRRCGQPRSRTRTPPPTPSPTA